MTPGCICRGSPRRLSCGPAKPSASSRCPMPSRPAHRSCRRSAIPTPPKLVRGHTGRLLGAFQALAVTMERPAARPIRRTWQDDKEPAFQAYDTLALSLAAMTGVVETLTFRTDAMRALATRGFSTATDLADWLVRVAGVPFREAHHITGGGGKACGGARRPARGSQRRRSRLARPAPGRPGAGRARYRFLCGEPRQPWRHGAQPGAGADRSGKAEVNDA